MTNLSQLQTLIVAAEKAIAEYEQRTKLEATELRGWLREMKHQQQERAWRERRNEAIDKVAEVSNALHRRTDSRVTY